jgi:mannosyltransferase OCH1-like enzyme
MKVVLLLVAIFLVLILVCSNRRFWNIQRFGTLRVSKVEAYEKSVIPKNVYQTYNRYMIPEIRELVEANMKISPEYVFNLFDEKDRREFIQSHFDERVSNAYVKINPKFAAAQADFWRFCVLYDKGGVYMDDKMRLDKDLDTVIRPDDVAILDLPRRLEKWRKEPTYEQGVLIFSKKHPYLRCMIEDMVTNIERGYVPECDQTSPTTCAKQRILKLTGPDAFAASIRRAVRECGENHRSVDYNSFVKVDSSLRDKQYRQTGLKHYSLMDDEKLYV